MWLLFLFFFFFKVNCIVKHFLFQTRFWFTLEVLLNIWKITSSQTGTVQRPFWGPLSLGHCRKTVTPSPRQGQRHVGSSRSHTPLHTLGGDAPCRKNLLHNPQTLLCPGDCEGQQWYEGQTPQTGLVQRQVNTPPVLWILPQPELCRWVLNHSCDKLHGVVLLSSNKTTSVEASSMHWWKITSTHQLQALVREVLSFWSPNSHQQPSWEMHQDLEGTWQACLVKMHYFLYLHHGEREGWITEWVKEQSKFLIFLSANTPSPSISDRDTEEPAG